MGLTDILSAQPNFSGSLTRYQYLTNREVTEYNIIIWFWTPDTLYGDLHSNDFIGLKYSPTFFGRVSTSKGEFRYYDPGEIHFEFPPTFNAPPVYIPRTTPPQLRENADIFITNNDASNLTTLRFNPDEGLLVYQRT